MINRGRNLNSYSWTILCFNESYWKGRAGVALWTTQPLHTADNDTRNAAACLFAAHCLMLTMKIESFHGTRHFKDTHTAVSHRRWRTAGLAVRSIIIIFWLRLCNLPTRRNLLAQLCISLSLCVVLPVCLSVCLSVPLRPNKRHIHCILPDTHPPFFLLPSLNPGVKQKQWSINSSNDYSSIHICIISLFLAGKRKRDRQAGSEQAGRGWHREERNLVGLFSGVLWNKFIKADPFGKINPRREDPSLINCMNWAVSTYFSNFLQPIYFNSKSGKSSAGHVKRVRQHRGYFFILRLKLT